MDFRLTTEKYYAQWIGVDAIRRSSFFDVEFVYSPERNAVQEGYSRNFDIYIFSCGSSVYFSYGDRVLPHIRQLKEELAGSVCIEAVTQEVAEIFRRQPEHGIKYYYANSEPSGYTAAPLSPDDYEKYLDFFKKVNPGCRSTDWVRGYFEEMADSGLCCGLFEDGVLVSCADSPTVPYMQGEVREIGINTLEEYRGRGYAADVCRACVAEIIKSGKCPLWSTAAGNTASGRLAEKVGFVKLADVFTMTL